MDVNSSKFASNREKKEDNTQTLDKDEGQPSSKRKVKKGKHGKKKSEDQEQSNRVKPPPQSDATSTKEKLKSVFSQFKVKSAFSPNSRRAVKSDEASHRKHKEQNREDAAFVPPPPVQVKPLEVKQPSGERPVSPVASAEEPICSDSYGYGRDFPNYMLEPPRPFEIPLTDAHKVPILKVSKSLMVLEVPPPLTPFVEKGDLLFTINYQRLKDRDDYVRRLTAFKKQKEVQCVNYSILRPLRTSTVPRAELGTVVPQCFELLPEDFDYLYAYMIVLPRSIFGMTVKSYNGKVYISAIETIYSSIAYKTLLVGDAILKVGDGIVGGIDMCHQHLTEAFTNKDKKFVRALIERAKSQNGLRQVKLALTTEKTFELNPRMGEDIADICTLQKFEMAKYLPPGKSIYKSLRLQRTQVGVRVSQTSTESPISTDVNNVTLLAPTPEVPSVPPGTLGQQDPLNLNKKNNNNNKSHARKKFAM